MGQDYLSCGLLADEEMPVSCSTCLSGQCHLVHGHSTFSKALTKGTDHAPTASSNLGFQLLLQISATRS